MANESLSAAKAAKNDEFYTQYYDIEREINAYLEFDPDVFRGKTVLLPCDDPEWSNFTLYFAQHFQTLGLKKLISTSYAPESKKYKIPYQPSLFEQDAPQFDPNKTSVRGKIFILDHDIDGDGRIDFHDLEWRYLDGDGDFRSDEVTRLRDEADIIVTNPPFSLFREFLSWIVEADKKFVIIGNMNALTYREVFPLIKDNKIWLGNGFHNGNAYFRPVGEREYASGVKDDSTGLVKFRNCCWFTNLDHGRRHQPLSLMTMEENIMYSKHKDIRGRGYVHYDNYDAIEVPYTDAIPSDYDGAMGVPITFLDKYCPDQFEILGITKTWFGGANKVYPEQIQVSSSGKESRVTKLNDGAVLWHNEMPENETYYIVEGRYYTQVYARVIIRYLKNTFNKQTCVC
ncbi:MULTISPECIES: adenine-specific methyltransferase EcoRI family protein [Bacteroidales]|nr:MULTISPECIES: adenine-specific methyltransferase EcoRI family protein [Bacteroidales]